MNCGRDKAMKLLSELDTVKGVGLIERVRQGQGKPARLYVKRFTAGFVPPGPAIPPVAADISDVQRSKKPTRRDRETRFQEVEKTDPSNIDINKTDINQSNPNPNTADPALADLSANRQELREEIKRGIDYEYLCSKYPLDNVESLLELMTEVESSSASSIRIGGELLPAKFVRRRFMQLERSHIEYVIECLRQSNSRVVNIRAYLLTALYNAPVTMGPYYSAVMRHDVSRK